MLNIRMMNLKDVVESADELRYKILNNTDRYSKKKQSAPLYRHWGSVQAVRPIGGVEV